MSPSAPSARTLAAALAAALLIFIPALVMASVEFAPPASYPLSAPGSSVSLGDLDGDGDLDAVVGSRVGTQVEVFLNQGDGSFFHYAPVIAAGQADVAIANLVGDGKPDLAVVGVDGTVSVYRGTGNGGFIFEFSVPVGPGAGGLAAADLDGDGLTDLAVLGSGPKHEYYSQASVIVLINQNGSFAAQTYPLSSFSRSIAAADLNGDHRPDLVTGNAGTASVFLNHGDGTFETPASYEVQGYLTTVAIGDLDGNGSPDIAVADDYGTMNALINDGNGAFAFGGNTPLYGQAGGVVVADFDGDGHDDVAVPRYDLGQVIALAGRGDGSFQFPALYFATGMGANGIAVGDVNGDHRPDVVTADQGDVGGGTMSVLVSGAPRPCRRDDLASGISASGLVSADFNADGAPDLAATNEVGKLLVFMNDGLGGFGAGQPYPLGNLSQNLSAGDLDGDSRADLVASNFTESTLTLYYNGGDGTFSGGKDLSMGPHPRWVEVADVDGDGRPDLVTADYNDAIYNGSVTVRRNLGDRQFGPPVSYGVGVGPYMVRAANLNHDDMLDLVVDNYDGQSVSILINHGDGTFAPEARYAGGWNLSSAVADFDHDGDNDVAVTNFKENTVTVFQNDGNGVLTRSADIAVGRQPRSIQAAIVKGDGDYDLAVALAGTSQVMMLENDGSGHFTAGTANCIVGVNPKTLIVGDFNRNAGQDLATANAGSGTVSVLPDVGPPGSALNRVSQFKRPRKIDAEVPKVARFALAMSRPNPTSVEAIIPFETPREAAVELAIYDIAGRAVKTLVDATLPPGQHEARWDGTTDRGDRARPGTYFYRLRAGDQRAVRTLMLR
jgi:VCBS repeat protein/flagellar hook capping protein FlgD